MQDATAQEQGYKAVGNDPEAVNVRVRLWCPCLGGQETETPPKRDPRVMPSQQAAGELHGGGRVWMGLCRCFSGQGNGRGEQVLSCQHSSCFPRRLLRQGWKTDSWGIAEVSSSPGSGGALLQVCFGAWKETSGDPPIPPSAPQQDLGLDSASPDVLVQTLAPDKHLSCTYQAVTPCSTRPALCLLQRETGSTSSRLLFCRLNNTGRLSSTGRRDR